MSALNAVSEADIQRALANRNFTKGILAINAASAATIKSTNAYTYCVDGVIAPIKAALSAQSIAVTHNMLGLPVAIAAAYVQPISTTVYYVVALDVAGNVAVIQGGYAGQVVTGVPGYFQTFTSAGGVPQALPATLTPIGILKVVTNASATFTAGTTLLDAAGVTVTYTDVSVLPTTAP